MNTLPLRRATTALIVILATMLVVQPGKHLAQAADISSRPNIVFVLVDDLRWDALGCTGHPFLKTPNIDRVATEGVNFRNAFVTTPLCSPSRASFLTGQYAHTHLQQGNGGEHGGGHQFITFPLLLQKAGYHTGYVGKWHMGDDDSRRPGFDRWVSFKGQGQYHNPTLNVDGKVVETEGYVTDILTGHAVEFVQQRHDQPFLLYLAHKAVHSGFTPAPRHKDEFAGQTISRAPNVQDTRQQKPVLTRPLPAERKDQDPGKQDGVVLGQLRAMLAIDEGMGRLFKALAETKQLDHTLLIFTSDNGFFWGEHGLGDKRAAYEESIRIPLLMRYPKLIQAGSTRDQMVLNVDIAPTLLDLAGTATPQGMHGRSLVPLLKDNASAWRESFLTEYFAGANARIPPWQAVRTKRWKYVHYTTVEGMDELYDLTADRFEMQNLIQQPDAAATLAELRTELSRLLDATK